MRHRVPGNLLGRPQDQRKALLRSLLTALLRHDEIITTLAKAKAVRPEAEKVITKAKKGYIENRAELIKKASNGDIEAAKQLAKNVHLRRQIASCVYDAAVVNKVFDVTVPRYKDRNGGYVRILKTGYRRGDATPMAIIQLV
jgi:large subunit ribosomal protein L17